MKWLQHLHTINRHKWLVMKYCFRVGLYKQGLLHDLSKYSWVEFSTGAKYFQGYRSPNLAEIEDKGYSASWLHHKGRNKHHSEYWTDYSFKGDQPIAAIKMPTKYVIEMFCDRIAANKIYKKETYEDGDPWDYFNRAKDKLIIHEDSKALLAELLTMLKDQGEERTFRYIRENVLSKEGKAPLNWDGSR
ncbi:catalase [Methanosarcina sp. Ant1]|nr:catalase [Methanosarcina sp. Ant1]